MLKFTQLARGSCPPNPGLYDLIFFSFQNTTPKTFQEKILKWQSYGIWGQNGKLEKT